MIVQIQVNSQTSNLDFENFANGLNKHLLNMGFNPESLVHSIEDFIVSIFFKRSFVITALKTSIFEFAVIARLWSINKITVEIGDN